MKSLKYILEVDNTDYDKKRTSDAMSKPKKKKNVLFIGDANTKSANSYAKQILNSGVVTGEIRGAIEGTAQEILNLVRAHNADNYNIVSIQYSNMFPTELNSDIDALRAAFDAATQYGAKLIVITNSAKDHVPYAHVKYEFDESIWNWLSNQQNESDYVIDIRRITNNKSFFEKNGLTFNKDTQNLITKLWLNVLKDIAPDVNTAAVKAQETRKQLNKQKTKKKLTYVKGQKSNDLIPIQKRLKELGYEIASSERGVMGTTTIEAIKKFQVLNGLAVSGQLSDKMISLLKSPAAQPFSDWKYAVKNILGVDEQEPDSKTVTPDEQQITIDTPLSNVATLSKIPANASEFIQTWKDVAISHMKKYGIPASITLAQASLESGWGKSGLTTKYNNFFGITGAYKGKSVKIPNKKGELFTWRVYDSPEQSFEDHSDLLVRKYKPSKPNATKEDWAQSLTNNGYADSGYGNSLLKMIKQYGLDKYDLAEPDISGGRTLSSTVGTGKLSFSSRAQKDLNSGIINPNLIEDIKQALAIAKVDATISTAKTGHSDSTTTGNRSRHTDGNAVDISIINGTGNEGATSAKEGLDGKGGSTFMEGGDKIVAALKTLGYNSGEGSKNPKGYIWRSNVGGNHWNHIHVSNKLRDNDNIS